MKNGATIETHSIVRALFELGLSSPQDLELFHPRTRDRADISVYRCRRSEVLVLSSIQHMSVSHCEEKEEFIFGQKDDRLRAAVASIEDSERRAREVRLLVINKRWLDVGTGHGGILDLLAPITLTTAGVEPQRKAREALIQAGYSVFPDLASVNGVFDVITLFHVYEHLSDPIGFLSELKQLLAPGGIIILEIPHARDFLLTELDCQSFRAFTLWSEHLLLHTRQSLFAFVRASGYSRCEILGRQRYSLANHLHWLVRGKPGGHIVWTHFQDKTLDLAYEAKLAALDRTDTLLATISR